MSQLEKLTIKGFKSIRSLEGLELRRLNVLIGANSAGKSNFIAFFRLLNELIEKRLQLHVAQRGGPDALLHFGRRTTARLEAELYFGQNGYLFSLVPTVDNRLIFHNELFRFTGGTVPMADSLGTAHVESHAPSLQIGVPEYYSAIVPAIQAWRVYHFHDTSDAANVKGVGALNDNLFLRSDAGNLAAFLYRLKVQHGAEYERIRDAVRLVMPTFDDFMLRPSPLAPNSIQLEWREQGSDFPFLAHQLSDGTLRFICLATLLLQPELPSTILIDEPELGLHPYAINVLASLLRSASTRTQLILATQSVTLIDLLELEDLIVVERRDGQSVFKRLSTEEFAQWMEEYSLGELWMKNVLGGRPSR
ncbi:AAA family ATPase [Pyxidicoccus fallax]|uniref:AAA family ATPase n=1 Tax=Pyxidicoccus fallax TaxID=394095 RepID=A0A848LAS9_9BACT|nr:AAA family ATPase [Pyxidicoccus fallax]NMO13421.1 AAA family ATPase [Pyxidicoccus fallax]NPC78317.1 AAA family ATPase [Pyxidicoccus fallax]